MKTLLDNKQVFSNNLAILGETGCGKTVLLKSLLDSSLQKGIKVIGIDWNWFGQISELGAWAEQYSNSYCHVISKSLDEIPSSASPVIFQIEDRSTYSIKEQGLLACHHTLSQSTNVYKTIFCINEVEPLLKFPELVENLETICTRDNIQVILVSQIIHSFSVAMLDNLPIYLVGRTNSALEIQSLIKTLQCPEITIRRVTKFANPRKQNHSSWLLAQDESVPVKERFQFYQH